MKRIYTRGGDGGSTGTRGGGRVPKDDPRIEALGALDEANCALGVVRSLLAADDERQEGLHRIQREMMALMSIVATPSAERTEKLDPTLVEWCEEWIDRLMAACPERDHFVLPGGSPVAAQTQMARVVTRRAERRLWTLHRVDPLPDEVLKFVNRLSDLLFALSRGQGEALWKTFKR